MTNYVRMICGLHAVDVPKGGVRVEACAVGGKMVVVVHREGAFVETAPVGADVVLAYRVGVGEECHGAAAVAEAGGVGEDDASCGEPLLLWGGGRYAAVGVLNDGPVFEFHGSLVGRGLALRRSPST